MSMKNVSCLDWQAYLASSSKTASRTLLAMGVNFSSKLKYVAHDYFSTFFHILNYS